MKKLFNDGWLFAEMPLGELPEESDYKPVDIPHDWQIWHVDDLYRTSDGWYKKTFCAEGTAGKIYTLRFEGVYMDSEVYLNGDRIFEWKYGYTTFDVPLALREGENEIKVRVRYQNINTRWYSGAGIFRDVWFRETGENYIVEDGTYVVSRPEGDWSAEGGNQCVEDSCPEAGSQCGEDGLNTDDCRPESSSRFETVSRCKEGIRCEEDSRPESGSWHMEIDTEICAARDCVVKHTLYDAAGTAAASAETAVPAGTAKVTQGFDVLNPELWSPEHPYLYSLLTELFVGNEPADQRSERVGFKSCRFDSEKGFFLNGRNRKLNGVCMHHDQGALGSAFNRNAARRQLTKLKEMGVNAIRTSHNPPAPGFMDLCDEMGFLVDSEAFDMWQDRKTEFDYARFFDDWHERDVASWIRRDRNRASIIMWSIGNEIGDTNDIPRGEELTKELIRCVRIHDYKNVHPVTIGSNHMRWQGAQNCAKHLGAVGYNYLESIYDSHHEKYPDWVIYGSETASTIQSRGIYHFPAAVSATTYDDSQCSSLMNCCTGWGAPNVEHNITEDRNRPYSLGQFIWTGWDYIGEPTPYHTKNSFFGHIDTAGFPKDSFYAYKAEWNKTAEPFVHLLPSWDWNEGQLIDIFAYSNCDAVEVFINGRSLGRATYNHIDGHTLSGRWQAAYEAGELKAVGYNAAGEPVCTDIRRTPGDAARLSVQTDRGTVTANGTDLVYLEITAVDSDGNACDNARNRVNVSVSGPLRLMGMDNGDSTDYEEYKTNSRRLFGGRLVVILGTTFEAGEGVVTVSSPGFPDETVRISVINADTPERTANAPEKDVCASEKQFCISEKTSGGSEVNTCTADGTYDTPESNVCAAKEAACAAEGKSCTAEGISCLQKVECGCRREDISVRKIGLSVSEKRLTPECPQATAKIRLYPANAAPAPDDIGFKAVTMTGVETNLLKIEPTADGALLMPLGDGVYRFRAFCRNGGKYEEVLSEIEMENAGFGPAAVNPYEGVVLASLAANADELNSDMGGGVLLRRTKRVLFRNVDFKKAGSDEITIGIYTYNENVIPVELYADGEMVDTLHFQAKNEWNVYKYNTFTLPRTLKGVHDLEFVFKEELRFLGFRFAAPRRLGTLIHALDNDAVYGDSFAEGKEMLEKIGNNVSVCFEGVDFENGARRVEITGRTRNRRDTIRLSFAAREDAAGQGSVPGQEKEPEQENPHAQENASAQDSVDLEFAGSGDEEAVTRSFAIPEISGVRNLTVVFLPGTDFDFRAIRFLG